TKQTRVGSPAVGADGKLYVPAAPKLFVLTRDGKVSWSKGPNVSSSSACGQPPLPPCQGPTSNTNSGVGTSTDKGDMSGIITPAIMPDGTLFVGTSEGKIIALNTKTKTVLWKYSTKADPDKTSNYGTPSFPVVDKNGTVYIGSVDHAMYAVNKKGKLVWKYKTGGGISEAAPALGSDGTLYFTSDDGYLYAVGK
ncbi:MAG: PQQ-binding-like beta-propeller repeat protein, partial [Candidatus Kerfeldbacteria bacterium]|nr:PQQ-binding-like beta-propeller repeat protein [Candidatus Kerfeldbacteria bacterium]